MRRAPSGWNFFFNPVKNWKIHRTLPQRAASVRGDYETAIRELKRCGKGSVGGGAYRKSASFIARSLRSGIICVNFVYSSMRRWLVNRKEVGAMINALLANVYWPHLHDVARAREILNQIIETMPHRKYSMMPSAGFKQLNVSLSAKRHDNRSYSTSLLMASRLASPARREARPGAAWHREGRICCLSDDAPPAANACRLRPRDAQ